MIRMQHGINHIGITVPNIGAAKALLSKALVVQVVYQSFGADGPPG
jgi:hypothetical protein